MKKILLKNNSDQKEFFYTVSHSSRSQKIQMRMKDADVVEILLPKKSMLSMLSLKLFSPEDFIEKNKAWVFRNSKKIESQESKIPLSDDDWKSRKEEFLKIAQDRIDFFNEFYGFKYKNISIKDTKTRWGSCSIAGNLNFNYRVFMLEPEQRDYIIIHELCHLAEMNHSKKFWNLVEKKSPNCKVVRDSLKGYNFDIS